MPSLRPPPQKEKVLSCLTCFRACSSAWNRSGMKNTFPSACFFGTKQNRVWKNQTNSMGAGYGIRGLPQLGRTVKLLVQYEPSKPEHLKNNPGEKTTTGERRWKLLSASIPLISNAPPSNRVLFSPFPLLFPETPQHPSARIVDYSLVMTKYQSNQSIQTQKK